MKGVIERKSSTRRGHGRDLRRRKRENNEKPGEGERSQILRWVKAIVGEKEKGLGDNVGQCTGVGDLRPRLASWVRDR